MLAFLLVTAGANAIVIRSDVPDSKYLVPASAFPALADLPMGGEGTLIAKRWVVTAAHAVQMMLDMPEHRYVTIGGKRRKVVRIIVYPGFEKEYDKVKRAAEYPTLKSWPAIKSAFRSMHDIALIELEQPVQDIAPVPLYTKSDELGKVVEIFGKGATGNGNVGQYLHSPHRGKLRRAFNRITHAQGQWLDYRFDCGPNALPLEGVLGDGDSGGPVLIKSDGQWQLAALSDWKHWPKGHTKFAEGVCGQEFSNSRISYYADWIENTIKSQ